MRLPFTASGSANQGSERRTITMIDIPNSDPPPSLAEQARGALTELPGAKLTRQPDTELDGSPAYYITGTEPLRGDYEEVGTIAHDSSMNISFTLNGYSDAERQEIIDSVVASFRWKDQ